MFLPHWVDKGLGQRSPALVALMGDSAASTAVLKEGAAYTSLELSRAVVTSSDAQESLASLQMYLACLSHLTPFAW